MEQLTMLTSGHHPFQWRAHGRRSDGIRTTTLRNYIHHGVEDMDGHYPHAELVRDGRRCH